MPELATGFQSLPPEFQRVIQLAQDQHHISVMPLQELVGGWSGAVIYLVSVASPASGPVQHFILKLDHKGKTARSDEIARHAAAQSQSPPDFARDHLAELAFERVEADGAVAIFYTIAGQSLQAFRPLSRYGRQDQLETIFAATNRYLLDEWNARPTFARAVHPQELLAKWLGFRLDPGGPTERFIREVGRADPDRPGFLIESNVFPNPLWYARQRESWGSPRPIDAIVGLQHGDLNTNNILVKFSEDQQELTGYYLIDFALFKEQIPLLYDLRYLEMSYLILTISQVSFARSVDLILELAEVDSLDPRRAPIEMAGAGAVLRSARGAFGQWVTERHPTLHDDLWGQYWLAGVAAGLSYCHKAGQADEPRLAGLIYAAANLKRYAASFGVPLPTDVELLYNAGHAQHGVGPVGGAKAKKAPVNLPVPPTPFFGRAGQVAGIKELLLRPDVRLVTLTGPGGTGKTRLSLQVAQEAADRFVDGVFFVSLADDLDSVQLVARIAQQLDVRAAGSQPLLDTVTDYLRDKQLLLVLDNFEQLVAAATLVPDLLAIAPRLKALATSRIALNLHGEREFPVPPFDLPPAGGEPSAQTLAQALAGNEAIRFFVERAQTAQPSFTLSADNATAVAGICRRLDGLPLALELAAARVKLLPAPAILARLDDRLRLLTGGARDLPARHQTLRNAIEWSYGLLNPDEKTLYARLGVFVGGFTLEAAEAVCNPDGGLDLLERVSALVNNSLLRQADVGGEPRFSMLETIRAYALERLVGSGELAALTQQHARYFGDVILKQMAGQQMAGQLYSAKSVHWLDWLEREHDNVRATLTWSQSTLADVEFAAALVMSLIWFWYRRGYLSEGRLWAERLLALPPFQAPAPPRALALQASGLMAVWQGEQQAALAKLKESLIIWQRLEDTPSVALMLMANGIAFINMGQDRSAQPLLQEALGLFEELQQPFFRTVTLVHLGNVMLGLGQPEQARARLEQAYADAQAIGDGWQVAFALNNLGEVARTQGQYGRARQYYEQSEDLLRRSGDQGDLARLIHTLGYIALYEGDTARAEAQFRESLTMFRRLGNRRGIAECVAGLAGLQAHQGQAERAATMLAAAEASLQATGGAWWPADRVEVERNRDLVRSALGEAAFATATKKGRALTLDQALMLAEGNFHDSP